MLVEIFVFVLFWIKVFFVVVKRYFLLGVIVKFFKVRLFLILLLGCIRNFFGIGRFCSCLFIRENFLINGCIWCFLFFLEDINKFFWVKVIFFELIFKGGNGWLVLFNKVVIFIKVIVFFEILFWFRLIFRV